MRNVRQVILVALILLGVAFGFSALAACGTDDCHTQGSAQSHACDCSCLCHTELAPVQSNGPIGVQLLAEYAQPLCPDRLVSACGDNIFRPPIA